MNWAARLARFLPFEVSAGEAWPSPCLPAEAAPSAAAGLRRVASKESWPQGESTSRVLPGLGTVTPYLVVSLEPGGLGLVARAAHHAVLSKAPLDVQHGALQVALVRIELFIV